MAQHIRVSTGFSSYTDQQLVTAAGAIVKGMAGNKAFTNPPVDLAAVQSALDELTAAMAGQVQGGTTATAAKNNKRDALVGLLRKLAHYVQLSFGNDLEVLLSSGFLAVGSKTPSSPVAKPSILSVDSRNTTQLVVKVGKVTRARCYEVRFAAIGAGGAPGPWQPGSLFLTSRSMPVSGLTPGTNYVFQVRAVGGSTIYSDWSDPVVHMCT